MAFDIMDWLIGHSPEMKRAETLSPEQEAYRRQMFSGLGGTSMSALQYLQSILSGDESAFKDFEAPIKRQYEQEVIPMISERFAGLGSGGSQNSSAFQQTLARSGSELSQNLAALRAGLKGQAIQQLQGLAGLNQQPTSQFAYDPGAYGIVGGFLQSVGEGAGKAGTNYFLG
jgi:hypothetical protein